MIENVNRLQKGISELSSHRLKSCCPNVPYIVAKVNKKIQELSDLSKVKTSIK
jgi:hypothetical protein